MQGFSSTCLDGFVEVLPLCCLYAHIAANMAAVYSLSCLQHLHTYTLKFMHVAQYSYVCLLYSNIAVLFIMHMYVTIHALSD